MRTRLLTRSRATLAVLATVALLFTPACTHDGEKHDGENKGAENGASKKAGTEGDKKMASELVVVKATPDWPCHDVRVEAAESQPIQFSLTMTRDMPSPGYEVEIVDVVREAGKPRIVAKTQTKAPEGPGLTVVEPKELRFVLGSLPVGSYTFELHDRAGADGALELMLTVELEAK